jgi:hypothetical protein
VLLSFFLPFENNVTTRLSIALLLSEESLVLVVLDEFHRKTGALESAEQLLKQLAALALVMDNFYGLLFCSSSRRKSPCTDKTLVLTFLYTVFLICR